MTEERLNLLYQRLSVDFSTIKNKPTMFRNDFAGMYVEDEDLHIILVNNADIEHYKQILNDDNVIYHYTDISYTDLIGIRNMFRDYYERFNIVSAAVMNHNSSIELTVTDEKSIPAIKYFLKSRNFTDLFIEKHFIFIKGEPIIFESSNTEYIIDTNETACDTQDLKSGKYSANSGRKIIGKNTYKNSNQKYETSYATVGFPAKSSTSLGIVTAWHFAVHTSKYYWNYNQTTKKLYANIASSADTTHSSSYDSTFVSFNSDDQTDSIISRYIMNTQKVVEKPATDSFINTMTGRTVHCYGQIHSDVTGTVVSPSQDLRITYHSYSGVETTYLIKDTIKIKNASTLDHGDSGGIVTYEYNSKVYLIGTIAGKNNSYQYINKYPNIRDSLQITFAD